jgi:NAD(P)-dependent dehydrogenase (short-subunit alcohol dehydrogenase family)
VSSLDPLDRFRLDGKVVVLTGASSGLGVQFARAMDSVGASLVLVARRADRLQDLADELRNATTIAADVAEAGAPQRIVDEAVGQHGRLDVVVNNAGISRSIAAIEDDIDAFRHELEVDLVAPFELARRAAAYMIDSSRPGSIVNIGSILGHVAGGRLKTTSYAAAKGGLHNLTRELASQWARKGIRVNAIAPGWFLSEMSNEMFESGAGSSFISQGAPMGRPGKPGELDGALLFLASDASSYVTGQILFVDGGWTAV